MSCDFFAGWVGGCCGILFGHPLDTLKVIIFTTIDVSILIVCVLPHHKYLPPNVTNLCRHPSHSLPYGEHHLMSGSATSTEHHKRHWNREGSYQVCGSRFYKISLLEFSNESNFKLQYPTNSSNKSCLLEVFKLNAEWMLNGWVSMLPKV